MYRLQEAFKNSILYDDDSKLLSMIAQNHINAKEYINIYRNNFYENLISSLSITYPTVKKLVGEDCFCSLAKLYVKRNCPKSSNLTNYGNKFPSFIKSVKELKYLSYLPDVAKLDYYFELIHNANTNYKININLDNIFYFDDFKIKRYIKLLKSEHPINLIFKFCHSKNSINKLLKVNKKSVNLLILKVNNVVQYLCLNNFEYNFILNFKKCNKLSNMQELYDLEDDIKVQKILSKILRLGLLTF